MIAWVFLGHELMLLAQLITRFAYEFYLSHCLIA